MGTDRNEILNVDCLCAKGRITVTFCSPDHGYAHDGQTWREDKIKCRDCEAKYTIVEQEKDLVLVSREDLERAQAAQKQKEQDLKDLEQHLWENLEKNGELDSAVNYLNSFNTASAAYRVLSEMYVFRGIDDFRQKFSKRNCSKHWIRKYFHPRALQQLLTKVEARSETLGQYFKDYSMLSNRAVPIPQRIGEPILHLNR